MAQRRGAEMDGFQSALDLLLDEDSYLAWCTGRDERPVGLSVRRDLVDYLSVVGGDGTFAGQIHGMRELIGDGSGWVAPSRYGEGTDPAGPLWHAVQARGDSEPQPACGHGSLSWGHAVRINEMSPTVARCAQVACQKAMAL